MTLRELRNELEQIQRLIEKTPKAPAPGHPDLERWAAEADEALDEVLAVLEKILA